MIRISRPFPWVKEGFYHGSKVNRNRPSSSTSQLSATGLLNLEGDLHIQSLLPFWSIQHMENSQRHHTMGVSPYTMDYYAQFCETDKYDQIWPRPSRLVSRWAYSAGLGLPGASLHQTIQSNLQFGITVSIRLARARRSFMCGSLCMMDSHQSANLRVRWQQNLWATPRNTKEEKLD